MVALFCVAAVSAMWQMLHSPAAGLGALWEAPAIARNLAAGRGFSNPYGVFESGPTAHLPPLFPAVLAVLLLALGDTLAFAYAAILLAVLAQAVYCMLFIPLSAEVFHDRRPGVAAAIFSAVVPTIEPLPQWEAIYAALAMQLFCLATARWIRSGAVAGLLCGVLLLLNPALLPLALAWMVYRKTRARQWAAFAAGAALVLLPWTVRNYTVMGGLFFVRDNLGSELYMSNADCSDARHWVNDSSGCHGQLQPNKSIREAQAVRELGELAYNRDRMTKARRWIAQHPARFLDLTARRIREFWLPTPEKQPIYEYSRWPITILSAAGIALLLRQRDRSVIFFAGGLLAYSLLYYFVQASTRYRSPVLWLSVMPAAYAAVRAVNFRQPGPHPDQQP
jgi:hypothetical protein